MHNFTIPGLALHLWHLNSIKPPTQGTLALNKCVELHLPPAEAVFTLLEHCEVEIVKTA